MGLDSLLLFILGGAVGALAYHLYAMRFHNTRALEEELESTRTRLALYKQEVSAHFQRTAELINNLTESYRKVHEHLSDGAQRLSLDALAGKARFRTLGSDDDIDHDDIALLDREPPRDYAAGSSGTLSEEFGFEQPVEIVEDIGKIPPYSSLDGHDEDDDEKPISGLRSMPRDYADKEDEDLGTLHEEYGYKRRDA